MARDARREPALFRQRDFYAADQMARLKLNKFIELTTIRAGGLTVIRTHARGGMAFQSAGHVGRPRGAEKTTISLLPVRGCGPMAPYALRGYYTRKDIREVVAYAAVRGIDDSRNRYARILLQAIDSYPWLAWTRFVGQSFLPLCVGKDRTLAPCESVWEELFELFPANMFTWAATRSIRATENCPDCQTCMRAEGLPDEAALQAWFTVCSAFAKPADAA
ncbi:MAG: hypothetical protein ACLT1W_15735 [Alistipes onderdonkii]